MKAMRKVKDIVFIDISDGSCLEGLQVLISKSKQPKTLTYSYGAAAEAADSLVINKSGS